MAFLVRQSLGSGADPRAQDFKCNAADAGPLSLSRVVPSRQALPLLVRQSSARVASYFLPKGYPTSVSPGYDAFSQGQMAAMVLSTACGVLSMQSMLMAIGVGAAGSLPLAATLNWVVKDGLGQLGGVIFAGLVNNQFDADPKKWRMIASVSLDVSSFIELLTPLAPGYFLPLAAFANVGKNVSFLAASASRAAIHKSFAVHENLADVTAKTGSQCILASLAGTSLGLSIAAGLAGDYPSIVAAFVACSALNLGATYLSLRGVTLTTLSVARLEFVVGQYMDDLQAQRSLDPATAASRPVLLTPERVMQREVLLGTPSLLVPLDIGADLDAAVCSARELAGLLHAHRSDEYLLTCRTTSTPSASSSSSGARYAEVHLLLKEGAGRRDILRGLVHSVVLRRLLAEEGFAAPSAYSLRTKGRGAGWEWNEAALDCARQRAAEGGVLDAAVEALVQSGGGRGWLIEELVLELRRARLSVRE